MKLSIGVTNYSWSDDLAGHLTDVARRADAGGIDTLWVADHLLQLDPHATLDEPMLEAYTTLGYLAAATTRVRLGTMVTWASIRPPALLIKAVTTVDVLSGGRARFGIGAGYQRDEADMMGLPFEPTAERFARMEEVLRLSAHMWDGRTEPFDGAFHRLSKPLSNPAPTNRPSILIGGAGEKRTLPLVARYADACNLFDIPDGNRTLRHKLDVLSRACADIGRDPATIEVTLSSRLAPGETTEAFVERCSEFARLGVDHVVLVTGGPWGGPDLDTAVAAVEPLRRIAPRHLGGRPAEETQPAERA